MHVRRVFETRLKPEESLLRPKNHEIQWLAIFCQTNVKLVVFQLQARVVLLGDADAGSESIPRFLKGGEPASPDVVLIGPKGHWKAVAKLRMPPNTRIRAPVHLPDFYRGPEDRSRAEDREQPRVAGFYADDGPFS